MSNQGGDLGHINIYFGDVIEISDPDRICRVKVRINGITSDLKDDDIPFYFPWYGLNYLPEVGDIVPVMIFDGVLTSGFYGHKINISGLKSMSSGDYEHYLALYDREVNGNIVSLTYKPSEGIMFMNGDTIIKSMTDVIKIMTGSNEIKITEDEISLGNDASQYALLGDNTIKALEKMMDSVMELAKPFTITSPIMTTLIGGCATPFTAAFLPAFTQLTATMEAIYTMSAAIKTNILSPLNLQSKKVKIE